MKFAVSRVSTLVRVTLVLRRMRERIGRPIHILSPIRDRANPANASRRGRRLTGLGREPVDVQKMRPTTRCEMVAPTSSGIACCGGEGEVNRVRTLEVGPAKILVGMVRRY